MGISKKHCYPKNQIQLSDLCRALGHPARISIVEILSEVPSLNCKDLGSRIKLSQSSISRHCQVLHKEGIIGYEVVGSHCFYKLDNDILDKVIDRLNDLNKDLPSYSENIYFRGSDF